MRSAGLIQSYVVESSLIIPLIICISILLDDPLYEYYSCIFKCHLLCVRFYIDVGLLKPSKYASN